MSRPEDVKKELEAMRSIDMDVPQAAFEFVDKHYQDVQTHLLSMGVSEVADMVLEIVK